MDVKGRCPICRKGFQDCPHSYKQAEERELQNKILKRLQKSHKTAPAEVLRAIADGASQKK